MYDGQKVAVFTPWGRELTASILFKYLKRDHDAGIVDQWLLCENTDPDQEGDREYAAKLERENDWIKRIYLDDSQPRLYPKQMNTGRFYEQMQDEDTIYVRMDDDIVWIEKNAIARLVKYRTENSHPFVCFPIIWNNAVCSYYLQQGQQMPSWWGTVGNYCMDETGWRSAQFAEHIHNHLLKGIEEGWVDQLFLHTTIQLPVGLQFSVSSFAQFGAEYKKVEGILHGEEEAWHSIEQPYKQGRPNVIVPNSLISHFSFYHQRDFLLQKTDLLDRYRDLAGQL